MKKALFAALSGSFIVATVASAQNIQKANNSDALDTTASWMQGAVPVLGNTAVWDNNVTGPLSTALGASMTWGGIEILNPGGAITILADGNELTISNGINMAQASQSLTLDNTVVVDAPQQWQVGNGQTLTLNGALIPGSGAIIRFNFDNNPASQAIILPGVAGSYVTANSTVLGSNAVGSSPVTAVFATYNDVDYAALNGSDQVVPGSSIASLYTINASGSTPSINSGTTLAYDVSNTNSYGLAVRGNYIVDAVRFNAAQTNLSGANVFTYNGVPSWAIQTKSGSTFSLNNILMTTNTGTSAVVVSGGTLRIYGVSSTYATSQVANEFLAVQNNPAANFVIQTSMTERETGSLMSKIGPGTMEMQAAGAWTGGTAVYGGTLLIDGAGTVGSSALTVYNDGNFEGQTGAANTAPVTVDSGGTNSVYVVSSGGQFANKTNLTFNAGTTTLQFIYSNTISPSGTIAPLLIANAPLSASNTVNINVLCSSLSVGQFPLVKYSSSYPLNLGTGTFAGTFNLSVTQPRVVASLVNDTASNSIDLLVTSVDQPVQWAAGNGTWDIATTSNWKDAGNNTTTYQQTGAYIGDNVVLGNDATVASPAITLNTTVVPGSVTVNSTKSYSISGSGSIIGTGSLTVSSGTLALSTANGFSGGIYLNGGTLNFAAVDNLGSNIDMPPAITFNGGTLQYASGNTADISPLATIFASGGATIDTQGNNVSFFLGVGSGGAGGLTKVGSGSLTLGGANTYHGTTLISAGSIALATGATLPNSSINVAGGAIFNATALTSFALASGQTLSGTGTVDGEISTGSGTISPAGTGVYGTLNFGNDLTISGGNLAMDVSLTNSDMLAITGNLTFSGGTLQLNVSGTLTNGSYKLMTFGGTVSGSPSDVAITGFSQPGKLASLVASGNQINLVIASAPNLVEYWNGNLGSTWDLGMTANWLYDGSSVDFNNGDTAEFNDSAETATVDMATGVQPAMVNVSVTNANYTFNGPGNITGSTALAYTSHGSGSLQIDAIDNNTGGTYIGGGTLQVGNGGTTGDLGLGNITNNGSLVYNQPDNRSVPGTITGSGSLTQEGSGILTLANSDSYNGGTIINGGTLEIGPTGSLTGAISDNSALVFDNGSTLTVGNAITGSGSVTTGGAGTLILAGNNDYYGSTTVTNGVLEVGSTTAIPNVLVDGNATGVVNVNGGTTPVVFDLAGHNLTINALSGTTGTPLPLVTNSGLSGMNTLTLADTGLSSTFSGQIAENPNGAKLALVTAESSFTLDGPATLSGGIDVIDGGTLSLTGNAEPYTGPILLNNGTTLNLTGSSATTFPANNITIANGATATFTSGSTGNAIEGGVIGGVNSTNIIASSMSAGAVTNQWQSFYGTVIISEVGQMRFSDTALFTNGGPNAIWDNEGELDVRDAGTVELGGLVGSVNALIGIDGPTVSGEGTFVIGSLNSNTVYSSTFGGNNNLIKVGTGSLTLNGTVDYNGDTTISNGSLIIASSIDGGSVSLDSSTNLMVITGATLDVSGLSPATLNLGDSISQSLAGGGTVNGSINEQANSTVAPGDSTNATGNLTATGSVTLAGAVNMKLDASDALTSDRISGTSISVQSGATLVVTDIGPTNFTYGQSFQLFSRAISGSFSSVTLPSLGSCDSLEWVNNLAVNGTISVGGIQCVNTTPGNIGYQLAGPEGSQTLTLSWAANQTGWTLQAQTNGLAANGWVNVAGSTATNSITVPIVPANGDVFYRLVYP
jgi:autotransporter-associated beta strand protein